MLASLGGDVPPAVRPRVRSNRSKPMSRQIYRGRIVNLRTEQVTLPTGVHTELELMEHPGAAAIVALDGEEVLLIRQYRFAASSYLWEIPAGTLQPGESPESCARRELTEEAGVVAGQLDKLGHIFTTPGFCNEIIHVYLARRLQEGAAQHDEDEVITEVRRVPLTEALTMIRRGEITDVKSCYGLFRAAQELGSS